MTILVINNKGQYNHIIQRSLQYLKIPTELVPNTLSIEEIEAKNPIGLILGGPSIEGAGNSEEYIKHFDIPILGNLFRTPTNSQNLRWTNRHIQY